MIIAARFFIALFCLVLLNAAVCSAFEANRELSLRGTIEQIVVDGETTNRQYVLAAEDGRRYELTSSKSLAEYARQRATVSGTLEEYGKLNVTEAIKEQATQTDTLAAAPAPTHGSRKVLVLLINFPDFLTEPITVEQARAKVFTDAISANEYFRANSFDRYRLTGVQRADGDVLGWITIPVSSSNCQMATTDWTAAADEAARNNGVDISQYNSIIYAFSRGLCGNTEGFGTVGQVGDPNGFERVWFQAATLNNPVTLVHELGHNLGFDHAQGMRCNGTNIPADCTIQEYGDPFDPMGFSLLFFFNNHHRSVLGWLSGRSQTVTTSGDYVLSAPSVPTKGNQVLQIPLKNADGQLTNYDYVLEYRRPVSFDNQFQNPGMQPIYTGVSIRRIFRHQPGTYTQLIDTTPNTYVADQPLAVGKTFVDTASGVSITTLSTNPKIGARVRIQISR